MAGVLNGFSVPAGVFSAITVAQLPAAQTGQIACVFDAATAGLVFGQAVGAGGGANKYLVWWNGAAWHVIGA